MAITSSFILADSLKGLARYYPGDGEGYMQNIDIIDVKSSDLFVSYQPYFTNDWTALDEKNDYHILTTSLALGHGITPAVPTSSNHWGNPDFGNGTATLPGDLNIGALGTSSTQAVNENHSGPTSFSLSQNYPNPFNPSTNISYSVKVSGQASLQIYNLLGQYITTADEGFRQAGQTYNVTVKMDKFSSGIYFYQLRSGSSIITKKMLLLK